MSCPPPVVLVVVGYDSGSRGSPALRAYGGSGRRHGRWRPAGRADSVREMHLGEQEPDWEALDAADAIVFGCPTYMGSASARMKAFMEESLRPQFLERRWQDKLAAGFTNSAGMSGDKLCTLQQLAGSLPSTA